MSAHRHPLIIEDRLDIHDLLARYGHIVDERAWDLAGELFTADCIYDMTDFDMGTATGVDEIVAMWVGPTAAHPLAHHATNILITVDADAEEQDAEPTVRVVSKGLGVGAGGRVGSVTYHDVVVRTVAGWRFTSRTGILRRA